jgi:hypothetical protein
MDRIMQFNSSEVKQGNTIPSTGYLTIIGAEDPSGNAATMKVNANGELITAQGSTVVTQKPWMAAIAAGEVAGTQRVLMYKFDDNRANDINGQTIITRSITRESNQVSVKSSSSNDTYSTGSGYQQVKLFYVDTNGDHQTEIINLNGTSAVNSVATDIYYLYEAMTISRGDGTLGTVTVYSNINGAGNNSYQCKGWEGSGEYGPSGSGLFHTGNKTFYITTLAACGESDLDAPSNAPYGIATHIKPHPISGSVADDGYAQRNIVEGTRRVIHMNTTEELGANLVREGFIIVPPEHQVHITGTNSNFISLEGWMK